MRRVRYNVAASLDGFITDSNGGYDWIQNDPTVDFEGIFRNVDTIFLGRRSYDSVLTAGELPWKSDTRIYVASRSLADADTGVTIVRDPVATAMSLRNESGSGEIWLFGGGELFTTLLSAGQVDSVEVTVVPVLLGAGTPLVGSGIGVAKLVLTHSHVYPSGMVALHYDVLNAIRPS
jgi:dihydrofolate reductase